MKQQLNKDLEVSSFQILDFWQLFSSENRSAGGKQAHLCGHWSWFLCVCNCTKILIDQYPDWNELLYVAEGVNSKTAINSRTEGDDRKARNYCRPQITQTTFVWQRNGGTLHITWISHRIWIIAAHVIHVLLYIVQKDFTWKLILFSTVAQCINLLPLFKTVCPLNNALWIGHSFEGIYDQY